MEEKVYGKKEHMRNHTDDEPFPCVWHGIYLSNLGLLEEHMQSHHGQTAEDCRGWYGALGTSEAARIREEHVDGVILCSTGV